MYDARGRVVGTWRRSGTGALAVVVTEPFTALPEEVHGALAEVADRLP